MPAGPCTGARRRILPTGHPPRLPAGALVHSRCSQAQGPFGYSRTGRHRYERTWYTPRPQGYRGRNRVRVFPDPKTGLYQVEWRENGRRLTRSLGHREWTRAKRQADEFAAGFAGPELNGKAEAEPEPLTLEKLFDIYGEEVTPTKAETSQRSTGRRRGCSSGSSEGAAVPRRYRNATGIGSSGRGGQARSARAESPCPTGRSSTT